MDSEPMNIVKQCLLFLISVSPRFCSIV